MSTNPPPALRYYYPSSFSSSPPPSSSPSSSSSSSGSGGGGGSFPMVVITVVGILAAFALLASYYAFVTRCQLLRSVLSSRRNPPWRAAQGRREPSTVTAADRRGLGLPLIRMLPVVKFTSPVAGAEDDARRVSVSTECAVCLSEFAERERVRLLPNCSHAFHIDCIDTWLQGSAKCPFCRRDVTPPPAAHPPPWRPPISTPATNHHQRDNNHNDDAGVEKRRCRRDELMMLRGGGGSCSIVIEVRGEHESWDHIPPPAPAATKRRKAESVGDEAIDTRKKGGAGEEFAVLPMRRSLSMDSSCVDNQLYVSVVRELLTQQRHRRLPAPCLISSHLTPVHQSSKTTEEKSFLSLIEDPNVRRPG